MCASESTCLRFTSWLSLREQMKERRNPEDGGGKEMSHASLLRSSLQRDGGKAGARRRAERKPPSQACR